MFSSSFVLLPSIFPKCLTEGNAVNSLNSWIGSDQKFTLIYSESTNGYTAAEFHRICNNLGPTVVIFKCTNGEVFGGYTSISWDSSGQYKHDPNAFLFSLTNDIKIGQGNNINSIRCLGTHCPIFGPTVIQI